MSRRRRAHPAPVALRTRAGARKLVRLRADGWVVVWSRTRGWLEWHPGKTDLVLERVR